MDGMGRVTCQISMSLDGFVAGPDQSPDDPIGRGGMRLHEWAFGPDRTQEDARIAQAALDDVGAHLMGRKMFGGSAGPWDPDWKGWWGDDPPFHAPVFVLTHHARDPVAMEGGTTFFFVTDGIESALEQARTAASGRDVAVAGGASTVQQYLAAGHLDELQLHIVPILLGAGERLLDGVGEPALEPVEVVASRAVTHVRYRIVR